MILRNQARRVFFTIIYGVLMNKTSVSRMEVLLSCASRTVHQRPEHCIPTYFYGALMKKGLVFLMAALLPLFFTFVSCGGAIENNGGVPQAISVTGATLNQSEMGLAVGESKTLKETVLPSNASNRDVVWECSDTAIASVTKGRVKGESPGKATITVRTNDGGYTATCNITVTSAVVPVTGLLLSPKTLDITTGQSQHLTATVQPDNATNKDVTWNSSNPGVATVTNGLVTAVAKGSAAITVRTNDGGYTETCNITVTAAVVPVTGVTISPKTLDITTGQSQHLTATAQPGNATNKDVSWTSSNPGVATVTNGLVTAVAKGSAAITVRTNDGGYTETCAVTVTSVVVPVTGVTISAKTLDITTGQSQHLTATVQPGNATNKDVTWTSSNPGVATVTNGLVTAVAKGSAAITVRTNDGGYTETCAVLVKAAGNEQGVYMAGYIDNNAALWVNGVLQRLHDGDESKAHSVFVSGGNVYAAGREYNTAMLWVNGVPQRLGPVNGFSNANSVFVSGGNVYVAGYEYNAATLWINGVPQHLGDGEYASVANSVFVSGSDVYVTGYEYALGYGNLATLWVNGVPQRLSLNKNAFANSVFVSGGNVYVSGYEYVERSSVATLWVNGVPRSLSDGKYESRANSVFVSGGDVYVSGYEHAPEYGNLATLWVNGVSQRLSSLSNSYANSVFASGGDVYVAGSENNTVALWVNGVPQQMGEKSGASGAISVFVDKGGAVSSISLEPTLALVVSQTRTLLPAILPINALDKSVAWSSDRPEIASVDSETGRVTARAPGVARITVKTRDGGYTAHCDVTVSPIDISVTGISLNQTAMSLPIGGTGQLMAAIQPSDATNQDLTWSSSAPAVATVSRNGLVKALTPGNATITATTADGGKTAACAVTVRAASDEPDVYVAGRKQYLSWPSGNQAALWVNGASKRLSNGNESSHANSVFVSGNDVYVAGFENNTATLWVNGVPQYLGHGSNYSYANSVFVSGNNVYVTGYEYLQSCHVATLWVNGVPQRLSDVKYQSEANCVFVSGSDVYVTGYEYVTGKGNKAALWVNGVPQHIDPANNVCVNSVFVSGDNVYVTGYEYVTDDSAIATLWVNGVPQRLTDGEHDSYANSVFVSGGDVYVVGSENVPQQQYNLVTLWVNGVPQRLTDGAYEAKANSVFVSGSDVYVAGGEYNARGYNLVTLWVNGVPQYLGEGSEMPGARSVFVDKGGAVSSISLEHTLTLAVGQVKTLAPAILPINALNKSVTWSSDWPEFASVDSATGQVTARAPGTATITATTQDGGHKASCVVTIAP